MASMPFIKVDESLRINLFNVTHVELVSEDNAPLDETEVYIYFNSGAGVILEGEIAKRFLTEFDNYCEELPTTPAAEAPADGELLTGRDFGDLTP